MSNYSERGKIIRNNSLFVRLFAYFCTLVMINVQTLIQLKAFARIDGLWLALLWTSSFACLMYPPLNILGNLLLLMTPVLMTWRVIKFRNYALDGSISYRRAFAYGCYMTFYASLIFAMVQCLYFQFLDNGHFVQLLNQSVEELKTIDTRNTNYWSNLQQSIEMMRSVSPIELAFMFMMQNLFIGTLTSTIVAIFGKKKK